MSLADELSRLEELHQRGSLNAEEFAQAKARLLAGEARPSLASINNFHRSSSDKWLGGVCGGLTELTGLASWIWRLIFALLAVAGGSGVLLYLALWIFVPQR
jgi:phage shock protein C